MEEYGGSNGRGDVPVSVMQPPHAFAHGAKDAPTPCLSKAVAQNLLNLYASCRIVKFLQNLRQVF